jgi:hypothetical protein
LGRWLSCAYEIGFAKANNSAQLGLVLFDIAVGREIGANTEVNAGIQTLGSLCVPVDY